MTFSYIPMPGADAALRAYKPVVEQFSTALPFLLWCARGQITPVQVQVPEDFDGTLGELYAMTVERIVPDLGRPTWVVASSEAYMLMVDDAPDALHTYEAGTAQTAYEAGDPNASECVVIIGIGTERDYAARIPFKRQPHRVRWGTMTEGRPEGGVADVLRALVR